MTETTRRFDSPVAADLTDAQLELRDAIVGGARGTSPSPFPLQDEEGRLQGPFGPMLLSPALGERVQALGSSIRFASRLTPRQREIVILTVARLTDCPYERYAHERVGEVVGLTEDECSGLREGDFRSDDAAEQAAHDLTVQLVDGRGHVHDDSFARVSALLDDATLYDLTVTVGYYVLIALTLNLFDVSPPTP